MNSDHFITKWITKERLQLEDKILKMQENLQQTEQVQSKQYKGEIKRK